MTTANDQVLAELKEGRRRFLALVNEVRPDLHRYCARMTGSVVDGEDVVQETLARAYYELADLKELPALRPWLFRIAHNLAVDYGRRYERRMSEPLETAMDLPADEALEPYNATAQNEVVRVAFSRFLGLARVQRSCVILKDVFGYSLDEIAAMLELSVSAIKAALVRGRAKLRALSDVSNAEERPRETSPTVARYAALFNRHDWEGIRAMLVDEVKLEVVSRLKASGRSRINSYFTNYADASDWYLVPAWLGEREVVAVLSDTCDTRPSYFIELTVVENRVIGIRDFRYVPYIKEEAAIELEPRPLVR
jgi:RNA polymerase sigma factor (sigma-70 family)